MAVLAVVWLAACGEGVSQNGAAEPAPSNAEAEHRAPIAAAEIAARDLSRQFNSSATVEAFARTRLASPRAGIVTEVNAEAGDIVEEGEILARLDMSEQLAELRRAETALEQAQRNYERGATLHERGHLTSMEYDRLRVEMQLAEREKELWQTRVDFGEITAPMNAVVTARHIEPGEGVQAQEVLFNLTSMELLVLRVGVSERDVVDIETGQSVAITLDARPDNPLEGHVRRIFPTADEDTRLVTVEIALPENAAEKGIRPGFLARLRMPIDPRPNAIAVPSAAIGEEEGEPFVHLVRENRLHRQAVERGVQRGNWTEILAGMEVGDVVLASDPTDMSEGQAVRIVGWRE